MKLKTIFLSAIFFLVLPIFADFSVSAQYNGNPPPQKIHLDKQIGLPTKSGNNTTYQYVDNISVDSYHFSTSEDILFRLIVKNVSLATLENVYIEDRFPWVLSPYADGFSLDLDTNTLTIPVGTLYPSESKTYSVRAKVRSYEWQSEHQITCHQNYSFANNGITIDDDTATFCIDKGTLSPTPTTQPTPTVIYITTTPMPKVVVKPIPLKKLPKKIPSTGPEFLLPLLLSTPVGIYLGKKLRDIK